MDWITDQIAIGNFRDAREVTPEEVDAILCLREECCDDAQPELEILCLPLADGAGNHRHYLDEAVDFIDDVVSRGDRVLVHCHAGRSRSVCIVARYFIQKCGMTSPQALELISAKREIYLSPGIEEVLSMNI